MCIKFLGFVRSLYSVNNMYLNEWNEFMLYFKKKINDCFNRGWEDFYFCCWNIENMNNESCDNKLIYCNIVYYENEK